MVFQSKVDAWLVAVLLFAAVATIMALLPFLDQPTSPSTWITVAFSLLLTLGLPLWLFLTTDYRVENGLCHVRSGPFRWTITLDSITSITPTRNPLSSPALSLDRLQIRYDSNKTILLSPKNQAAFIAALEG